MPGLEKYFLSQLQSHHCQLPPSDDFEYIKQVSRFKNFFLVSEKNLQSFLKVKSLSAIFYDKRRQIRTSRVLVLHPFSRFYKLWQLWMFFVFFASFILLPFFCAFHGPLYAKHLLQRNYSFTHFYAILASVVFFQLACLLHIVVTFLTGYFIPSKDEVVIHIPGIAKHYLCTFFFFDFASSLPIDAILLLTRGVTAYSQLSHAELIVLTILPLLKFSRLPTLNHYFRTLYGCFCSSFAAYNLVVVIVLYFLIIHWCTCFFMIVPKWMKFELLFENSAQPEARDSLLHQYVICGFVSLTTLINTEFDIRYAEEVAPNTTLFILIVTGKIFRFVILIFLLQLLSTRMAGKLKYLEMMDQVAHYMQMKKFPRSLRRKVKLNYTYLFRKEYLGERGILQLLSDNMRREVLLRMHENLIQKVRLFSGLSENLIFDFVSSLRPEIYLANDVVYKVGDVGECMYFISFGTVVVYGESNEEIGHLHDGDHFGEISLIFQLRRTSTVMALETTELYCLESQDFLYVVKEYPAIFSEMEKQARARYDVTHDSGYTQEGEDLKTKWKKAKEAGLNYNDTTDSQD